jgi:hypothetical protein
MPHMTIFSCAQSQADNRDGAYKRPRLLCHVRGRCHAQTTVNDLSGGPAGCSSPLPLPTAPCGLALIDITHPPASHIRDRKRVWAAAVAVISSPESYRSRTWSSGDIGSPDLPPRERKVKALEIEASC